MNFPDTYYLEKLSFENCTFEVNLGSNFSLRKLKLDNKIINIGDHPKLM